MRFIINVKDPKKHSTPLIPILIKKFNIDENEKNDNIKERNLVC